VLLRAGGAAEGGPQLLDDVLRPGVALADRGVERIDRGLVQVVRDRGEGVVGEQTPHGQVLPAQRLGELLPALLERLLAALLREPVADLAARTGGLHEAGPVAAQ